MRYAPRSPRSLRPFLPPASSAQRHGSQDPFRLLRRLAFVLPAALALGCEDAAAPTAPISPVLRVAASATGSAQLAFGQVSAGLVHTCGVSTAGAAYCWGSNVFAQLGDGTTTDRLTPVAVVDGLAFQQVSAGSYHTCGVTTADVAYCWGSNSTGQLGIGTADGDPHARPVAVAGGLLFLQVRAGADYTCGVTMTNVAYCWGINDFGQLGEGTFGTDRLTPTAVAGGLAVLQVSAGLGVHTCGLTTSNVAYCWGLNSLGQLGIGTDVGPEDCSGSACSTTPVAVVGGLAFPQVGVGGDHTCGATAAGAAYCWGYNALGQLGIGTNDGPELCTDQGIPCSTVPVAVQGGLAFGQLSVGGFHNCGFTAAGVAYCWGWNDYAQLGDGTFGTDRLTPVAVAGGLAFAQLSGGASHTCGVTTADVAYCWGANFAGQLGIGSVRNGRRTPTRVRQPTP